MSIAIIATLIQDGLNMVGRMAEMGIVKNFQPINYQEYIENAHNPAADYASQFWKELQEDVVNRYPQQQPEQQG